MFQFPTDAAPVSVETIPTILVFLQGHTEGYSEKTLHLSSLTVMNGAKLTAADSITDAPSVTLLLDAKLRVMAGGLVQGKWINISADDIDVEASAAISADGMGYGEKSGPSQTSGTTAPFKTSL